MCSFVNDGRHGDRDPLFAWPRAAAGPLPGTRAAGPRSPRHLEAVAIMIARARVDGVGEDAVDDGVGPQAPSAAWPPRASRQPLEDLADGHLLIDKPAVQHADDIGFGFIDDQVSGYSVTLEDVAIAVRGRASSPLPGPSFVHLT